MTHKNNKKYGKPVKRANVKKIKAKFDKAIEKAIEQESYERRSMNIPKEQQKRYPNIFEVEE